jgi:hypothetical protein
MNEWEEVVLVPDLDAKKRARIPSKKFGLPEKARTPEAKKESGNYPMPDREHAVSAKGRAKAQLKRGNLAKDQYERVVRKANRVLKKDGA